MGKNSVTNLHKYTSVLDLQPMSPLEKALKESVEIYLFIKISQDEQKIK